MILSVILIHLLSRIRSNSSQSPGLEELPQRAHLPSYPQAGATRSGRAQAPDASCSTYPARQLAWSALMLPTPKQRARAAGMAGSSSTWNAGDPSRSFLGPRATHALMTELAALGRQAPCTPQELDRRHHGHRVPRNPDSKTAFGRPAIDRESSRAPIGFETWEGSRGRATGYRPSPRTRYRAAQDTVTL